MAWVYILRGTTGRHYIGSTSNLTRRLDEHHRGLVHTTCRLGLPLQVAATREFSSMNEARQVERPLKAKKNPEVAIYALIHG